MLTLTLQNDEYTRNWAELEQEDDLVVMHNSKVAEKCVKGVGKMLEVVLLFIMGQEWVGWWLKVIKCVLGERRVVGECLGIG